MGAFSKVSDDHITVIDFRNSSPSKTFKSIHVSPPQESPLIIYLNICKLILFVPFHIKWNCFKNRFTLQQNKLLSSLCAIFHTIIVFFNIFALIDYIFHFNRVTGSYVSAAFHFVDNFGSAMLWFLFLKLVWFKQGQLERLLNISLTDSFTPCQMKILKLFVLVKSLLGLYFNVEVVSHITLESQKLEDLALNFKPLKYLCLWWPSLNWIWIITHSYLLLFYGVMQALISILSFTLLVKSWDFKKKLDLIEVTNPEKVFKLKLNSS